MPEIASVILAAGRGTRFGAAPKLLASLDGQPLVRHAAEAAFSARPRPVIAVLGAHAAEVGAALDGLDLMRLPNPAYGDGIGTTLQAGLAALPPGCTAAIVILGDMPKVTAAMIDRLADAFTASGGKVSAVVPVHEGRRGNPVLLNLAILGDAIAGLRGDRGAGPLLAGRTDVLKIAGDAGTALDIDTPDALAGLTRPTPRTG